MKKLAEKTYWDSIYKDMPSFNYDNLSFLQNIKKSIKHLTRDYSNFVMWDILFKKYLPKSDDMKIIEIGCAPGKYLINFKKIFGYEPYGVEYSEKGVSVTKDNFKIFNFVDERIISADFFDDSFLNKYEEKFDIVFSRGFIEHYDDVKRVVDRHVSLIKKGGYIIISIPNLSGINKCLSKILNIDSYLLHNTSIMNEDKFSELFPDSSLEKIYCGYVGLFSVGLFNTNSKFKYYLYRIVLLIQRPIDFLLRIFLKDRVFTCKYTSPYLLYIGIKK